MTRWLILCLGVALAALALHGVMSRSPAPAPAGDHIDDASRAKLERVLREAEREERR